MLPGVGIFGTSALAKSIVIILKNCGFEIVAVWSRKVQDAADFATEMGIPFSTNKVDGLLLKPEVGFVAIVCTPHLQSPIAVKALGIGKHVFATPPAGTSQLEVLKMVKAATYYPSLLSMMCHGLRFLPTFTMMKQRIDEGYIGEPYLFEVRVHGGITMTEFGWECDVIMGGGALSTHGSYIIDVLYYLSSKKATSVNGLVKTYVKHTDSIKGVREITSDDFCSFQMELEDGITVCCILNNHCHGEFSHEITAVGSKGRLIARDLDLYGKLSGDHSAKEHVLHYETHDKDEPKFSPGDTDRVPFSKGTALTPIRCIVMNDSDLYI